ncbi:hypothetical protein E9993_15330 [Labilibacter sediminis]|nr:hypothetical protein E9993_15330 [Labilibacter sediminis]
MDLSEYKKISKSIFISFIIHAFLILMINFNAVEIWINSQFGQICSELFKQYFYGAIGGTIACSLFLKNDKERNEIESLKDNPDPMELRLPDVIDKRLYIQRIITSGILAVLGALIIIAVFFSYLEVDFKNGFILKHKMFLIISSLSIGLYQLKFLGSLEKLFEISHYSKQTKI